MNVGHVLTSICLAAPTLAVSSALAEPVIPDTPAGKIVAAYFKAFNSGDDDTVRAFHQANTAASSMRRVSIDERITSYRNRFNDWGVVEIKQVIDGGPYGLLVVVQTQNGADLYDLTFDLETETPHKLLGNRVAGPFDPKVGSAGARTITDKTKETAVNRIADELIRAYVFEDVGQQMASDLSKRLAAGEYDKLGNAYQFSQQLTTDLRAICHDLHLRVRPRVPRRRSGQSPNAGRRPGADNHGFIKVEVLPGNVGYIKLTEFAGTPEVEIPAAAAMAFVADTDALIFDLRQNGGGSPHTINFLSGYLFDERVHLNTFDNRLEGRRDTYSRTDVPGKRYGQQKPVYVLTSSRTFSAAEEFTYNLKHLKRATIVGETTGGGAHPVTGYTVNKYFEMSVPFARAINPVTKTNWEGIGVIPHVEVPADQALERAHELALQETSGS